MPKEPIYLASYEEDDASVHASDLERIVEGFAGDHEDIYTSPQFESLLRDGLFYALSVEQLEDLRPDLTELDLAACGIRRDRDFVTVFNGVIQRGIYV